MPRTLGCRIDSGSRVDSLRFPEEHRDDGAAAADFAHGRRLATDAERATARGRRRAAHDGRGDAAHPAGDVALGTDLVEIAQVESAMHTFGRRYLERVFTPLEIEYCLSAGADAPSRFAARFAAKEATLKAIRVGDDAIDWRCIEVQRQSDGSCRLALRASARDLADRRGIDGFALSMSHDGRYASAVVVGRPGATRRLARISRTIPRGAYER